MLTAPHNRMSITLPPTLLVCLLLCLIAEAAWAGNFWIKQVKFNHIPLKQVVRQLHHDYGVNLYLKATPSELAQTPPITLQLNHISYYNLLHYICLLSGMAYRIDGELVFIGRRLRRNEPLHPERLKPNPLAGIPPGTSMVVGQTSYMPIAWSQPKTVITGNSVSHVPAVPTKFIKTTTGTVFGQRGAVPEPAKSRSAQAKQPRYQRLQWRHPINNLNLTNRLRNRQVEFELNDASLREAIAKIRSLSATPQGRYKKPVNFIIIPFPGMDKIKVDCYFTNISLISALSYICKVAGVKYQIDKYAVVIYKSTRRRRPRR